MNSSKIDLEVYKIRLTTEYNQNFDDSTRKMISFGYRIPS